MMKTSHTFIHRIDGSKSKHVFIPLLPSGKTQLMERDALGVVGQAGFAKNK